MLHPVDITPPADVTFKTTKPFIEDHWGKVIITRWDNPTDTDFSHVKIERYHAGSTTTLDDNYTTNTFIDNTVDFNKAYRYIITAIDDDGNESSGYLTPFLRLKRAIPRNIVTGSDNEQIDLTWDALPSSIQGLGGYYVYYGEDPANLNNTIDVGNVNNYSITGLTNGTTYYIAIASYNAVTGQPSQTSLLVSEMPNM